MNREENRYKIIELLNEVKREGIGELIEHMNQNGFFDAPCSGKYHLNVEGGLAQHSLNVYQAMDNLAAAFGAYNSCLTHENVVVCSILHDLGKMGDHGKANYVEKLVRSKTKNKETGEYDMVRSTAEPFETNKELLYIPHEVRSIEIAERFIKLTEEESHAIYYHNGKYTHVGYDLKETPMQMLLHFADLWVSRVEED